MVAYVNAGAKEAWLVYPESTKIEVYSTAGRLTSTQFAIELHALFI